MTQDEHRERHKILLGAPAEWIVDAVPLGYAREGDVVTLRMAIDDYQALLLSLGMAAGQVARDREALNAALGLANRLNVGNPDWTPYRVGKGDDPA